MPDSQLLHSEAGLSGTSKATSMPTSMLPASPVPLLTAKPETPLLTQPHPLLTAKQEFQRGASVGQSFGVTMTNICCGRQYGTTTRY